MVDQDDVPAIGDVDVIRVAVDVVDQIVEQLDLGHVLAPGRGIRRDQLLLQAIRLGHPEIDPRDQRALRVVKGARHGGRDHVQAEQLVELVRRNLGLPGVAEVDFGRASAERGHPGPLVVDGLPDREMADAIQLEDRLPRSRDAAQRLAKPNRRFREKCLDLCRLQLVERLGEQARLDRSAQKHRRDDCRSAGESEARVHEKTWTL
jgi:hypothetical protein